MHPLANAPAGAEGEEIARVGVGMCCGLGKGEEVVLVAVWFEAAWGGVAGGVGADGPDVVEDAGAFGDQVALWDLCVSS